MTTTTVRATQGVHFSFDPLLPVLLVVGPGLMAAARLLLVPIDDDDLGQSMRDMAAAHVRSDAGWLLAMASCSLLLLAGVALARRLAGAGRVRTAVVSVVLTSLGWTGCAALCLAGVVMSAAGRGPDFAAQLAVQEKLNEGSTAFVFLMVLAGCVGYVVLSVGLARAGQVSKGAAALLGIGGAGTLITMGGPIKALLVLAALLLLAGHLLSQREPA